MARITTARTVLVTLAVLASTLFAAAPANANYVNGGALGCGGYNAGGRDAAGNTYMACNVSSIRILRPDGSVLRTATSNVSIHAIAPSPDGAYVYAIGGSGAMRLARGADGNYRRDGFTFRAPTHYAAKGWRVCGWGIATDAYGKIYISNGGWCEGNPNEILKYAPDGTLITRFGDFGIATKWMPCGGTNCVEWNRKGSVPGQFQPNMSIAVTADGNRVWVADQNNQRIQVFARTEDTINYAFERMWSGEGTRYDGQAGAIYGVALDPWGYGYVSLTTARVIYRVNPDLSTPVLVADWSSQGNRPHTIAVDGRGSVLVGEWGVRFDRTSAAPGPYPALPKEPKPDVEAPVVRSVTAPSETTDPSVQVTVVATDDIGVTQMRIADESGDPGPWRTFEPSFIQPLSGGIGTKLIYVQVRDKWGRESDFQRTSVARRPIPDLADPVVTLQAPSTSTTSAITIAIDASDDLGVTHIRFATEEGTFSEWQPWSSGSRSVPHTLTAGLGTRMVVVQVRDAAYKVSNAAQATVLVALPPKPEPTPDPHVPVGGSSTIAGGGSTDRIAPRITLVKLPVRSCTQRILVRLATQDNLGATQIRFANENGRFGAWRPYKGRMVHVLSRGATRKVVYVQVRDAAGNTSSTITRKLLVVRCR
ncbi:MAG: chromosome condensation regulator [Thermoleophilia bacterium]|nr:chromosome condensation regulator [Thermoleophilia bacterium]